MPVQIKDGETIVFIGDSITDCGRRGPERPHGNGYVKLFTDMVAIREPEKRINVINKGIGGDVVTGLRDRWHDDVLRNSPDWLSVKIGINDMARALRNAPDAVPPELYREAYDDILSRTRDAFPDCRMLLIDPFYISTETAQSSFRNTVLQTLPKYIEIVHEMSERYKTRLVRTHEMFAELIRYREPDYFCPEPVHPFTAGHLAIAEAVYRALS